MKDEEIQVSSKTACLQPVFILVASWLFLPTVGLAQLAMVGRPLWRDRKPTGSENCVVVADQNAVNEGADRIAMIGLWGAALNAGFVVASRSYQDWDEKSNQRKELNLHVRFAGQVVL